MLIRNLELSARTKNVLIAENIYTVADLLKYRSNDLLKFPNFGRKSLIELEDWLAQHNLELASNFKSLKFKATFDLKIPYTWNNKYARIKVADLIHEILHDKFVSLGSFSVENDEDEE